MSNTFMRVDDVAAELGVSKSYAYKIVRKLNTDVLSCKGMESTIPILQGSSFICGTGERLSARKKDLPTQEHFVSAYAVVRCGEKFFQELFKKCSAKRPHFLLYVRGCIRDTKSGGITADSERRAY